MQRREELRHDDRGVAQIRWRILGRDLPGQEGDDAPGPRVAEFGIPDPNRRRDRQRETGLQNRRPPLLVDDELGRHLTPRQPDKQFAAQSVHDVVPPVGHELDGQAGEIRLLRLEKPSYRVRCHVQLSGRHAVWTHAATLAHRAIGRLVDGSSLLSRAWGLAPVLISCRVRCRAYLARSNLALPLAVPPVSRPSWLGHATVGRPRQDSNLRHTV